MSIERRELKERSQLEHALSHDPAIVAVVIDGLDSIYLRIHPIDALRSEVNCKLTEFLV